MPNLPSRRCVAVGMLLFLSLFAACHRGREGTSLAVAPFPPSMRGLTVMPARLAIVAGQQQAIRTIVTTARPDVRYAVRYVSSAPGVASVDSTGVVTGASVGAAAVTITVTSEGRDGLLATTLTQRVEVIVAKP